MTERPTTGKRRGLLRKRSDAEQESVSRTRKAERELERCTVHEVRDGRGSIRIEVLAEFRNSRHSRRGR